MKYTNNIKYLVILLFAIGANNAFGQADSIISKEVEVIKAYQPTINESYKITSNPTINDTATYTPTFEYKIFSTDIPNTKSINHLPVVQLGNAPINIPKTGFLKAGFGNALTPYGEFIFNTATSDKTDFGFQLYHFSSHPKIKLNTGEREKTPFSNNMATVFVKNYFRKAILEWDLNYSRDRFDYYGFADSDTATYRQNESFSGTLNKRQVFNEVSAKFRFKSLNTRSNTDYNIGFAYDYFWNATGQQAHQGTYDGTYTLKKRKYQIIIPTELGIYTQTGITNVYDSTLTNHQKTKIRFSPYITESKDTWDLKVGLNFALILDNNITAPLHMSPNAYFAFNPIPGIMSLFANVDGGFVMNNYASAVKENPYIDYRSDIKPTEKTIELSGGIKGKVSQKISYLFDVDYTIANNELFYYLEATTYENWQTEVGNTFKANYNDLNTLRFGGNIRFSGEHVSFALKGNYYTYDASATVTDRPNFDANLEASVKISDRINANLNTTVIGPRKAQVNLATISTDTSTGLYLPSVTSTLYPTLKTVTNIGLGANYKYSESMNLFFNADNIINQHNQTWIGYNSRGLLVLLGASYTF